ncbi:o-succinylbenzoate synthase [Erwinia sp. 198]|uniref:o-succinylbenzoate synthase n=1 Tax=Erwinia sp. 198 TaxID=2022746 RepID=UPI000F672FEE|nr:o-succinylbenzoate synthase [Erwinia sp. 198]RRZ94659.1 o-succinylbenzoate synthase [Erwinia sp. 198]
MRRATLFNYNIPVTTGVVLRNRRVASRHGLLVRLEEAGREGWGEIAPLPGFSSETVGQAQTEAQRWLQGWRSGWETGHGLLTPLSPLLSSSAPLPKQQNLSPSVAFGLSCALAELAGVMPSTGNYSGAMLCTGDPDELIVQLNQRPQPLAKLKVGLYEAVRDGITASLLLEAVPTLTLRLDANQQWSLEKARQFARFVPKPLRSRIAFIEEPCRTQEDSRLFAQETDIALAWDESSRMPGYTPTAEPHLRAIVIKPMLVGSLATVRETVVRAGEAGLTAVISSSIESSLGLTQLARIACWLTPGVAPGLDTLSLMQQQLVRVWPGSPLPLTPAEDLEEVC